MVSDSEPRYRLVDSNGNVVGSLFAEADGTLKLQEGTSGSDNELAFGTDGALSVVDLQSETISNNNLTELQFPDSNVDTTVDNSPSGDTWFQNNRNVLLYVYIELEITADGTSIDDRLHVAPTQTKSAENFADREESSFDTGDTISFTGLVPPMWYFQLEQLGDADKELVRINEFPLGTE